MGKNVGVEKEIEGMNKKSKKVANKEFVGKHTRMKAMSIFLIVTLVVSMMGNSAFAENAEVIETEQVSELIEAEQSTDLDEGFLAEEPLDQSCESNITLIEGNAYILVEGDQVFKEGSLQVPNTKDFTFTVAVDSGFSVEEVKANADGASVLVTVENETYGIAQADLATNPEIELEIITQTTEATDEMPATQPIDDEESAALSLDATSPLAGLTDYTGLFRINEAGDTIVGFSYSAGITPSDIVIPEEIKAGVKITTIGEDAFAGLNLNSVVMSDSITAIGARAFQGNPLTGGVTLSNNLTVLENETFMNAGLRSIVIPEGVTSIGDNCFYECSSLNNVVLPNSLNTIGPGAFGCCQYLYEITIPSEVTTIGDNAFYEIEASETRGFIMRLPNHLPNTIAGCPWGSQDNGKILWKEIEDSCFSFDVSTQLITGIKPAEHANCNNPSWHQSRANVVIPSKITVEGTVHVVKGFTPRAFFYNQNIMFISFETDCVIKEIPESAFESMWDVREITLPHSVETIGVRAFADLTSTNISLHEGLKRIEAEAFMETYLPNMTLPASLEYIGSKALNIDDIRTSPPIIENIRILGNSSNLVIEEDAFSTNSNLKNIYMNERTENSVAGQPWGAQHAVVHWKDATYEPEIIATNEWLYNPATKTLLKYIGTAGNNGGNLVIPKELIHQGKKYEVETLSDTQLLPQYILLNSGASIRAKFNRITVSEGYERIPDTFINYAAVSEVILPSTLKEIGDNAFDFSGIKKINLPEGLTKIGESAFWLCGLSEIVIPKGVTEIPDGAFGRSFPVKEIKLHDGITSIGDYAFSGNQIESITVPASVTSLSSTAFNGCRNLDTIYIDRYRTSVPPEVKNNQPWGALSATVIYKGENVEAADTVVKTSQSNGRARIIDLAAEVPAGDPNITDIVVSADGGQTFTNLFNGVLTQYPEQDLTLAITENGTYTFYFKTAFTLSTDPLDWYSYEVEITDIGQTESTAQNVEFSLADAGNFTKDQVISDASPVLKDVDSNTSNGANYEISDADLAAINALDKIGDSVDVTLSGNYKNAYDLTGDVYQASGFYNADSSNEANHLGTDGKYAYTNYGSSTITVTLAGYSVTFDLNAGAPASGASVTEYNKQFVKKNAQVSQPLDPQREGYSFQGWKVKGTTDTLWSFTSNVTSNLELVAQWIKNPVVSPVPTTVSYSVEYYDLGWYIESAMNAGAANTPDTPRKIATDTMSAERGSIVTLSSDQINKYKPSSRHENGTTENNSLTISLDSTKNVIRVNYIKRNTPPVVSVAQNTVYLRENDRPTMLEVMQMAGANATDREDGRYPLSRISVTGWQNVQFGTINNTGDPYVISMATTDNDGFKSNVVNVAIFVVGENEIIPATTASMAPPTQILPGNYASSLVDGIVKSLAAAAPFSASLNDDATALAGANKNECWIHWCILLGMFATTLYSVVVIVRRRRYITSFVDWENSIMGNTKKTPQSTGTYTPNVSFG